jgi:hypothetical protein
VQVEVAHEALIQKWEQLRRWLNENRAELKLIQQIEGEAQTWKNQQKEKQEDFLRLPRVLLEEALKNKSKLKKDAKDYVGACVELRDRQKKEKEDQQKRDLKAAQDLEKALQEQRNANEKLLIAEISRTEKLIRSAWISLKPFKKSYEECGTWLEYGLRDLYCQIKPFVDYSKLSVISGLPIFKKGSPHTDNNLNFEGGYEFGHYNPEFLTWIQEKAINPNGGVFKHQLQSAYDSRIGVVAKAFYQAHQILFATPEEFESFKKKYGIVQKQYQKLLETRKVNTIRFHQDPLAFEEIKSKYLVFIQNRIVPAEDVGFYLTENCRWLADYLATPQNETAFEEEVIQEKAVNDNKV